MNYEHKSLHVFVGSLDLVLVMLNKVCKQSHNSLNDHKVINDSAASATP